MLDMRTRIDKVCVCVCVRVSDYTKCHLYAGVCVCVCDTAIDDKNAHRSIDGCVYVCECERFIVDNSALG